jgi:hypothetical protein
MPAEQVQSRRFSKLIEINTLISSGGQSIQQLLSHIVEAAVDVLGGDSASLLLVDEVDDALFFSSCSWE